MFFNPIFLMNNNKVTEALNHKCKKKKHAFDIIS